MPKNRPQIGSICRRRVENNADEVMPSGQEANFQWKRSRLGFLSDKLLAITASICFTLYFKHEQRRSRLNGQLIAAIEQHDYPTALNLIKQGADGSASSADQTEQTFRESVFKLLRRIAHRSSPQDEASAGENALTLLYNDAEDKYDGYIAPKYTASHPAFERLAVALINSGAPTDVTLKEKNIETGEITPSWSLLTEALMSHHHAVVSALCRVNPRIIATIDLGTLDLADEVDTGTLLDHGVDVEITDSDGLTAAFRAEAPKLRVLITHGANITKKDRWGGTPLTIACSQGNDDSAILLLDLGVAADGVDAFGLTALSYAAQMSNPKTVKRLLDAGADINHQDDRGWTPLMHAMIRQDGRVAKFLLERGADVNLHAKDGQTALSIATDDLKTPQDNNGNAGWESVIRLLRQHGAR